MEIRNKILKTALKLFVERGFSELYITDVIKEMNIDKREVYYYFKSKDQLINEIIEKFWSPHLNNIIRVADVCDYSPKKRLLKIFRKYSETESYLNNGFKISKFNYTSILFLIGEGLKVYTPIPNIIIDFNKRLLETIEYVIEDGKRLGEILSTVNSKYMARYTLELLQSNIVLWSMNQNTNIRLLFETSFKHLWNAIKASESNLII